MVHSDLLDAVDLGAFYRQSPWAVDALIYLIFFTGLAHVTIGRRLGVGHGRAGAAVSGAVGLSLAFGAAAFANHRGFMLAELGGLAWIILTLVLGYLLFDLCRAGGLGVMPAALLAVLGLVIGLSLSDAHGFLDAIGLSQVARLIGLAALLGLAWFVGSHRRTNDRTRPSTGPSNPVPADAVASFSPTSPATYISHVFDRDSETTTITLLSSLAAHFHNAGFDSQAERLFANITRHQRPFAVAYHAVIRQLATIGWTSSTKLDDSTARVLISARDNVSAFDRAAEIALHAYRARNRQLFAEAVQRLIQIEKESETLSVSLEAVVAQLDEIARSRTSDSTGGR